MRRLRGGSVSGNNSGGARVAVVTVSGADQLLQPADERARSHAAYVVFALSEEKSMLFTVASCGSCEHAAGGDGRCASAHANDVGAAQRTSSYKSMWAPVSL